MKKFLSMLLALTVVFTYTFGAAGSVFAATTTDAKAKAMSCVQNVSTVAKQTVAANGDAKYGTWEVKAANWDLAYAKAYDNALAAIADSKTSETEYIKVLNAALGTTIADGATTTAINAAIVDKLVDNTYKAPAAKPALLAQLALEKDAKKATVAAVKTDVFSTTEYKSTTKPAGAYIWTKYAYVPATLKTALTAGDECYTASVVADSIISGVNAYIDAVSVTDADYTGADAVATAKDALDTFVATYVQLNGDANGDGIEDESETWTYTLKAIDSKTVLTKAVEEASGASNAAAVAAAKATIASNIAGFKSKNEYLVATGDTKAAFDDYLVAYETAATYLVENDSTTPIAIAAITDAGAQKALVKRVAEAKKAIDEAADFVKETNNDGSKKYNEKKIASNLETILISLYKGDENTYTEKSVADGATVVYQTKADKLRQKNVIADAMDEENTSIKFAVDSNGTISTVAAVEYYDLEWTKVKEAVAAYNEAVDAATTEKDMTDAAKALHKALKKIDKASDVLATYAAGGTLNATATAEFTKLNAYANALDKAQGATDPLVFDITDIKATMDTTGAKGTLVKFYIDNNARTKAEVVALYNAAKAVLDGAKTTSVCKNEAAAVVAQIAALPAKAAITTSDKDAIAAAYKAHYDLKAQFKVYVTNKSTLDAAVAAVKKAESDSIFKAYKVLPAKSALTVADKDAVKAVADAIKAYNKTEMYGATKFDASTTATVEGLLTKIKGLELDAVKAAVKAIPATKDIKLADKEVIEAARKALDAYVDAYADELTSADVAAINTAEKTVAAAESTLAPLVEAAKWTDKDVKANLLDMDRKVTIWRTSKKSIRVTAVGSVSEIKENGYTVKYTFYKKAPGAKAFKAVKTTTSNKFVYKNLKKGTNKFQVKVSVYNAEGKLVASKTTFYRAAKVK